ncbi:MAG: hypothetical protein C0617_11350 [Desulfuromonas sp.]|uniref:NRDE family protein n=1 Tax=Desulfuromonas sp. TaxID=892 RepID=UPI000CC88EC6|nr:NRDE family protein [Desulfuromonas sp.]PLX83515.1 MAG: hypothetical protein C0617_11350 [Desulfuromonas sp.]
MCLILFSYNQHPDNRLVMAANRDEFFARPTAPAAFWEEAPGVLSGRDLQGGGSWFGITRCGRLAAVTNFRDRGELQEGGTSRGLLVSDYLLGEEPPGDYLRRVARRGAEYKGFNLLAGDGEGLWYYSNRQGRVRRLPPGLYGLSNHLLDTPWPKVAGGKVALAAALDGTPDPEALFALLADTTRVADAELPDTGFGPEWERILSSRFIAGPDYGTRSSSVLLVGREGRVEFTERSYAKNHGSWREERFTFQIACND